MRHTLHLATLTLLLFIGATTRAQITNPDNLIAPPPPNPARHQQVKPTDDLQWLWPYTHPEPVGDELGLLRDPRFPILLHDALHAPQTFWRNGNLPLDKVAQQHLGVTQGGVQGDNNRYITLTGCVPHNCPDQGLLWIDTLPKHQIVIFAATDWTTQSRVMEDPDADFTLWIFPSHAINPDRLPFAFVRTIRTWDHPGRIKTTLVVDPDGTPHKVNLDTLGSTFSSDQP